LIDYRDLREVECFAQIRSSIKQLLEDAVTNRLKNIILWLLDTHEGSVREAWLKKRIIEYLYDLPDQFYVQALDELIERGPVEKHGDIVTIAQKRQQLEVVLEKVAVVAGQPIAAHISTGPRKGSLSVRLISESNTVLSLTQKPAEPWRVLPVSIDTSTFEPGVYSLITQVLDIQSSRILAERATTVTVMPALSIKVTYDALVHVGSPAKINIIPSVDIAPDQLEIQCNATVKASFRTADGKFCYDWIPAELRNYNFSIAVSKNGISSEKVRLLIRTYTSKASQSVVEYRQPVFIDVSISEPPYSGVSMQVGPEKRNFAKEDSRNVRFQLETIDAIGTIDIPIKINFTDKIACVIENQVIIKETLVSAETIVRIGVVPRLELCAQDANFDLCAESLPASFKLKCYPETLDIAELSPCIEVYDGSGLRMKGIAFETKRNCLVCIFSASKASRYRIDASCNFQGREISTKGDLLVRPTVALWPRILDSKSGAIELITGGGLSERDLSVWVDGFPIGNEYVTRGEKPEHFRVILKRSLDEGEHEVRVSAQVNELMHSIVDKFYIVSVHCFPDIAEIGEKTRVVVEGLGFGCENITKSRVLEGFGKKVDLVLDESGSLSGTLTCEKSGPGILKVRIEGTDGSLFIREISLLVRPRIEKIKCRVYPQNFALNVQVAEEVSDVTVSIDGKQLKLVEHIDTIFGFALSAPIEPGLHKLAVIGRMGSLSFEFPCIELEIVQVSVVKSLGEDLLEAVVKSSTEWQEIRFLASDGVSQKDIPANLAAVEDGTKRFRLAVSDLKSQTYTLSVYISLMKIEETVEGLSFTKLPRLRIYPEHNEYHKFSDIWFHIESEEEILPENVTVLPGYPEDFNPSLVVISCDEQKRGALMGLIKGALINRCGDWKLVVRTEQVSKELSFSVTPAIKVEPGDLVNGQVYLMINTEEESRLEHAVVSIDGLTVPTNIRQIRAGSFMVAFTPANLNNHVISIEGSCHGAYSRITANVPVTTRVEIPRSIVCGDRIEIRVVTPKKSPLAYNPITTAPIRLVKVSDFEYVGVIGTLPSGIHLLNVDGCIEPIRLTVRPFIKTKLLHIPPNGKPRFFARLASSSSAENVSVSLKSDDSVAREVGLEVVGFIKMRDLEGEISEAMITCEAKEELSPGKYTASILHSGVVGSCHLYVEPTLRVSFPALAFAKDPLPVELSVSKDAEITEATATDSLFGFEIVHGKIARRAHLDERLDLVIVEFKLARATWYKLGITASDRATPRSRVRSTGWLGSWTLSQHKNKLSVQVPVGCSLRAVSAGEELKVVGSAPHFLVDLSSLNFGKQNVSLIIRAVSPAGAQINTMQEIEVTITDYARMNLVKVAKNIEALSHAVTIYEKPSDLCKPILLSAFCRKIGFNEEKVAAALDEHSPTDFLQEAVAAIKVSEGHIILVSDLLEERAFAYLLMAMDELAKKESKGLKLLVMTPSYYVSDDITSPVARILYLLNRERKRKLSLGIYSYPTPYSKTATEAPYEQCPVYPLRRSVCPLCGARSQCIIKIHGEFRPVCEQCGRIADQLYIKDKIRPIEYSNSALVTFQEGQTLSCEYFRSVEVNFRVRCPECSKMMFPVVAKRVGKYSEHRGVMLLCSCGAKIDFAMFTLEELVQEVPDVAIVSLGLLSYLSSGAGKKFGLIFRRPRLCSVCGRLDPKFTGSEYLATEDVGSLLHMLLKAVTAQRLEDIKFVHTQIMQPEASKTEKELEKLEELIGDGTSFVYAIKLAEARKQELEAEVAFLEGVYTEWKLQLASTEIHKVQELSEIFMKSSLHLAELIETAKKGVSNRLLCFEAEKAELNYEEAKLTEAHESAHRIASKLRILLNSILRLISLGFFGSTLIRKESDIECELKCTRSKRIVLTSKLLEHKEAYQLLSAMETLCLEKGIVPETLQQAKGKLSEVKFLQGSERETLVLAIEEAAEAAKRLQLTSSELQKIQTSAITALQELDIHVSAASELLVVIDSKVKQLKKVDRWLTLLYFLRELASKFAPELPHTTGLTVSEVADILKNRLMSGVSPEMIKMESALSSVRQRMITTSLKLCSNNSSKAYSLLQLAIELSFVDENFIPTAKGIEYSMTQEMPRVDAGACLCSGQFAIMECPSLIVVEDFHKLTADLPDTFKGEQACINLIRTAVLWYNDRNVIISSESDPMMCSG